jgi:DNA invertase Pin-like site-specific DNA recombinase
VLGPVREAKSRFLPVSPGAPKSCGGSTRLAERTEGRRLFDMLANLIQIAKATNLSRQTVYRIKGDPAAAEAALATWEAA